MTEDTLVIEISRLRELCVQALVSRGADTAAAEAVFSDYLEAEAAGRLSHGFVSFDIALGAFPVPGRAEIVAHTGSVITVEGHGDSGHVAARLGIEAALPNLRERGVYVIGIRNISRFNTPGPIARFAASGGAVAIVAEYGGKNFMAPHGGKSLGLSTNPLGVAVPGTDPLFCLDIATSERAFGYITLAKMEGSSIPSTWALDADGHPTADPSKASALLPFGGYKGFGLSLALEILAGCLVGVPVGHHGELARRGALILLLSPNAFGVTADAFSVAVKDFLASVVSTPPIDEAHPVRYPGQESSARVERALREGKIEMKRVVWQKLVALTQTAAAS